MFIDSKLQELSSIIDIIDRAMCKLINANEMLKRKFYEVEINLEEEKRIVKRKNEIMLIRMKQKRKKYD